ncbi:MAG: hypothetical protein LBF72_00040 [Holosporales bacterium]|jgi:hypothetical protein|nr:hypothetical protein [Holosporales bacterium]
MNIKYFLLFLCVSNCNCAEVVRPEKQRGIGPAESSSYEDEARKNPGGSETNSDKIQQPKFGSADPLQLLPNLSGTPSLRRTVSSPTQVRTARKRRDNDKIVVQVLGTPAAGKSVVLRRLQESFIDQIKALVKSCADVDLDKIREAITSLSVDGQLLFIVKALDLFQRVSKHPILQFIIKNEYDAVRNLINKELGECLSARNITIACSEDGVLSINGARVSPGNVASLAQTYYWPLREALSVYNMKLGNILNRYEHLTKVLESVTLEENLRLDNVGTSSDQIINCLRYMRNSGFLVLTILIHPKTPAVNILFNAMRAMSAHMTPPAYLFSKYIQMEGVSEKYLRSAERVVEVSDRSTPETMDMITKCTKEMSLLDNLNPENKHKVMDLIVVDKSSNIEIANDAVNDKFKNDVDTVNTVFSLARCCLAVIYNKLGEKIRDTSNKSERKFFNKVLADFASINRLNGDCGHDAKVIHKLMQKHKAQNRPYLEETFSNEGRAMTEDEIKGLLVEFAEYAKSGYYTHLD